MAKLDIYGCYHNGKSRMKLKQNLMTKVITIISLDVEKSSESLRPQASETTQTVLVITSATGPLGGNMLACIAYTVAAITFCSCVGIYVKGPVIIQATWRLFACLQQKGKFTYCMYTYRCHRQM